MKRALLLAPLAGFLACAAEAPRAEAPESPDGAAQPASPVALVLEGSRWVVLDSKRSFRLRLVNRSHEGLDGVRVHLRLPPEVAAVDSDPPADADEDGLAWTFPRLAPGTEASITVRLRGRRLGQANLVATCAGARARKGIEVVGVPSLHVGTYDTEDPVAVGEETVYVVEVRNEGTQECTNVRVSCRLPEDASLLRAEARDIGHAVDGQDVAFDPWPILRPGEKLVCRVRCKAEKAAKVIFAAEVRCDQFEEPVHAEEATSFYH
ncbi:MAG: DUF11 domain-containing protein [Planctomycetota bacterium]|nr:MAG: DUF11 domain-containing protein [Planctomycetota bacterium]